MGAFGCAAICGDWGFEVTPNNKDQVESNEVFQIKFQDTQQKDKKLYISTIEDSTIEAGQEHSNSLWYY